MVKQKEARIILKRIAENIDGVFGVLLDNGDVHFGLLPFAVSVENNWRNNQPFISCIPSGTFPCSKIISPTYGETFIINEVPGRDKLLFHWGNMEDNTEGCIIVAEQYQFLYGKVAVLNSRFKPNEGFNEFMNRLKGINSFLFTIEDCDGKSRRVK